ncbi:CTP-dependent riboflavin kinase [Natrinema salinisoli]|uniref:CTP-dependent riboflavin kinase n=1 Tax=Natrinema salinisoli TaxID=2878535 RepID=UPI001CF090E1|nr:CTP-dependent riboflavin kinase [Natrinema salinisoli]
MNAHNNETKATGTNAKPLDSTKLAILNEIGKGEHEESQLIEELASKIGISESEVHEQFTALVDRSFIETTSDRPCLRPSALSVLNAVKTDGRESSVVERYEDTKLRGKVTSGVGKGKHFVGLSGYKRQFQEKLGYTPYPGTLNIELDDESTVQRRQLDVICPIWIEGWSDEDRDFGPAVCHPVTITTDAGRTYEQVHMVYPFRTEHDQTELELLAPDNLRETMGLTDGQIVEVNINEL